MMTSAHPHATVTNDSCSHHHRAHILGDRQVFQFPSPHVASGVLRCLQYDVYGRNKLDSTHAIIYVSADEGSLTTMEPKFAHGFFNKARPLPILGFSGVGYRV